MILFYCLIFLQGLRFLLIMLQDLHLLLLAQFYLDDYKDPQVNLLAFQLFTFRHLIFFSVQLPIGPNPELLEFIS